MKYTSSILRMSMLLLVVVNLYLLSYVHNDGNYPIWWNVLLILALIVFILAVFMIFSKTKVFNWKYFYGSCCVVLLLSTIYLYIS